jgi:hypothetical protein
MLLNTLSSYGRETKLTVLSGSAVEGSGIFRLLAEILMPPLLAARCPTPPSSVPIGPRWVHWADAGTLGLLG